MPLIVWALKKLPSFSQGENILLNSKDHSFEAQGVWETGGGFLKAAPDLFLWSKDPSVCGWDAGPLEA